MLIGRFGPRGWRPGRAGRPVFVVDGPTRRILARHRIVPPAATADEVQARLVANLPRDPALFNEYHALLVRVAKEYCRAVPRCARCPLMSDLRGRLPAPLTSATAPARRA